MRFETNKTHEPGFVLKHSFGPGAGYKGGFTAYLAWNAGSFQWQRNFRGHYRVRRYFPIQLGITRNGNRVPYTAH